MKSILDWVAYISKCCEAISEGLKIVVDKWPRDSPGRQPAAKE